jgi:hypothetical protein
MKRLLLLLPLLLAGCPHQLAGEDDACRGRTDFRRGGIMSCCGGNTWIWNGHACVQDLGHCACDCSGPDCAQGYPNLESCMDAMALCRGAVNRPPAP